MQIIHFSRIMWRQSVRSPINSTHQKREVYLPEKSITEAENAACYSVPVDSVLGKVTCSGTHTHYLLASTGTEEEFSTRIFLLCVLNLSSPFCVPMHFPHTF